ncbi:MAG: dTDP-4-dehydrorhamnose reductase [Acidobacteriota bacterium]
MRVLVTGSNGQLGSELRRSKPPAFELSFLDLPEWDLTAPQAGEAVIAAAPHLVIHAAAYTAVDRAEEETELAYAVNEVGTARVAEACRRIGSRLIFISTDFVFDGGQGRPYAPGDTPNPLGVYGASKLAGEKAALGCLGPACRIVRTSWLYSRFGKNFVYTMLRLMKERDEVRVVYDQVGSPTWAADLARALWRLAELDWAPVGPILHWSDAGVASWYDFAVAIQEEALERGLLARRVPVTPISTPEFPTPARRPSYSVLDKTLTWAWLGRRSRHWRAALRDMLDEVVAAGTISAAT